MGPIFEIDLNNFTFTTYAKNLAAKKTFYDGKAFIEAALLLEQKRGASYVSLHLICQGTELILKSFLYHKDYDRFINELKKTPINHSLTELTNAVIEEYSAKSLDAQILEQVKALDEKYSKHKLRYTKVESMMGYYLMLETSEFTWKLCAVVKLAARTIFALTPEEIELQLNKTELFVYRR